MTLQVIIILHSELLIVSLDRHGDRDYTRTSRDLIVDRQLRRGRKTLKRKNGLIVGIIKIIRRFARLITPILGDLLMWHILLEDIVQVE